MALLVYFRSVVVVGQDNIPQKGPVIFAANHPNMVLDAMLACTASGRTDAHFWAKASIFKGTFGWILKQFGGVPVARSQDGGSSEEARRKLTDGLFAESYKILEKGESIFLFPEGISYTKPQMTEIKTGTARLALGFANAATRDNHPSAPIVPIGLNYVAKDGFRSQVFVEFGKPIQPEDWATQPDPSHSLTVHLKKAMKACTINVDSWQDLRLVDTARQIYLADHSPTLEDSIKMTQKISDTYEKFKDEPFAQNLKESLQTYQAQLDQLGIEDFFFVRNFKKRTLLKTLILKALRLAFLLPVFFVCYLLHYPIHYLGKSAHKATYVESICQAKIIYMVFLVPLLYGLYVSLAWFYFDLKTAVFFFFLLPTLSFIHIHTLDVERLELSTLKLIVRMLYSALFNNALLQGMEKRRSELSKSFEEIARKEFGEDRYKLHGKKLTDSVELLNDRAENKIALQSYEGARDWIQEAASGSSR